MAFTRLRPSDPTAHQALAGFRGATRLTAVAGRATDFRPAGPVTPVAFDLSALDQLP